jgi:hypothetical protein
MVGRTTSRLALWIGVLYFSALFMGYGFATVQTAAGLLFTTIGVFGSCGALSRLLDKADDGGQDREDEE